MSDAMLADRVGRAPAGVTGSIVIPAHNEERVIARGLHRLIEGLDLDLVEVIVVANGCTDGTAAAAAGVDPRVRVLEIPEASKPAALRAGERAATRMPRIFVDADVVLTGQAATRTLATLAAGAASARPPVSFDSSGASRPVRRYYRARMQMPSLHRHAWGAGVFGLSAQARGRFAEFPDTIGDDLCVDQILTPGELRVVDADPIVITTPRDSRSLVRILRRAQRTKVDPALAHQATGDTTGQTTADLLRLATSSPTGALDAVVYAGFALLSRIGARSAPPKHWERDDSSRD